MDPVCFRCYPSDCQGHSKKKQNRRLARSDELMTDVFKENIPKRNCDIELEALDANAQLKKRHVESVGQDDMDIDELENMMANTKLAYVTGGALVFDPSHSSVLDDQDFIEAGTTCGDFEQLIVHQGAFISDEGMQRVLWHKWKCGESPLERFEIGYLPNVTDNTLFVLGDYFPGLLELHITGHLDPQKPMRITSEGVAVLASCCKMLEVVNLNWCRGISNKALFALAANCPMLREFSAYSCLEFTQEGFESLVSSCINLEQLELCDCTQVTDEWLYFLIEHAPNLRMLDVTGCSKLSDNALKAILKHFNELELHTDRNNLTTSFSQG